MLNRLILGIKQTSDMGLFLSLLQHWALEQECSWNQSQSSLPLQCSAGGIRSMWTKVQSGGAEHNWDLCPKSTPEVLAQPKAVQSAGQR